MHLRRALLLFAIVLGLAAIAASVSRPGEDAQDPSTADAPPASTPRQQPTVEPGASDAVGETETVALSASLGGRERVEAGTAATLEVSVDEPGLVEIPLLGVTAPGEPLTPARFDILAREPGRYPVVFTPAASDEEQSAGTLVVVEPQR